jgi:DNA (cytosine-5)-methyltransferase 1
MTHGSLFSGIGGFDLAAEWMGWTNVFHCEFAEFPRKILHHYWPEAISYHDIKTTDFTRHLGAVDIITGGFPCQPYSAAGKRKGKDDDRHLWPEMLRVIREVRPRWVVGENVFGLTTWDGGVVLEEVCADLEAEGYAVQPFILPACAVGAPHRRDRVWIVANAVCSGAGGNCESINNQGRQPSRDREESLRQTHGPIGTSRSDATGADVRFAANTDGLRRPEKHDVQQTKLHIEYGEDGLAADATSYENNGHGSGRLQPKPTGFDESGFAANADLYGHSAAEVRQGVGKGNDRDKTGPNDAIESTGRSEQAPANADSDRREGSIQTGIDGQLYRHRQIQSSTQHILQNSASEQWQDFPTVTPVCGGDDGLPTELDGITFPKWRNESIKAYGNAIVPQVALQIFQAIQQMEDAIP